MNLQKNISGQKIRLRAFDATTGLPKTGDAANITMYVNLDYAGVNALGDTSATEINSTTDPGGYLCDLTQGETNANVAVYSGKSSTANVVLVSETPNMVPANFSALVIDSNGIADADVRQWLGTAASTPTVAGVPNVNVKTWNDLATVALPLVPTTAGRTLDVTATGAAGIDWGNVENQGTAVSLTSTSVAVATAVATVTTVTNLTNAPTNGDFTAVMKTSIGTAVAASAVASVTGNVGGNVVGSVGSVVGAVGSVTGAVGSVTGNVGGNVVGSVGSVVAGVSLSATGSAALTESYRANGAAGTLPQLLYEIVAHLSEASIAGTTKTINKLDHVTPAETFTLDSATAPTSITRAT